MTELQSVVAALDEAPEKIQARAVRMRALCENRAAAEWRSAERRAHWTQRAAFWGAQCGGSGAAVIR